MMVRAHSQCSLRRAALLLSVLFPLGGLGAETNKPPAPAPPPPAPHVSDPLASFRVKPGFRIELVAAEPLVTAPAAMAFDSRGRLFVAEMRDYPDRRNQNPHLGQIRLLEDMDDSGAYQTSTVYATNLPWPSAVACFAGGIFVAATPDIYYFKDSRGNGIADTVKLVFSGFGGRGSSPDPGALLNSFNWSLDNCLHCGTTGLGGTVSGLGPSLTLDNSDFAFDPRTLAAFPDAGPTRAGMSFSDSGRKFLCDADHPLLLAMCEPRYLERNPFFVAPPQLINVAAAATVIYRPAPEGRDAGTRAGLTPAPGRPRGTNALVPAWMGDPRSCVVYRGSTFGTNYLGNVFVADSQAHVIHRFTLRPAGLGFVAERAAGKQQSEFLVSSDDSFHPVQLINGPDGALCIADFRAGHETGRIYRIVPHSFKRPRLPHLDQLKTYDLVGLLAQANGWHAETAARLLCEERDPAAPALLTDMLEHSIVPLARLRAFSVLDGLGALQSRHLIRALLDSDEQVREHAVQVAERLPAPAWASGELWEQLSALSLDPSPRVRYQLALTLGDLSVPGRDAALGELLFRDLGNPWMTEAVLSSLREGPGPFLAGLAGSAPFRGSAAGQTFMERLAFMIGVRGRMEDVRQVLDLVDRASSSPAPPYGMLLALGEGLRHGGSSLRLVDKQNRLQRFFDGALATAINDGASVGLRVDAVRLLGLCPADYGHSTDWLRALLLPTGPYLLEAALVGARGRCDDPLVAQDLIRVCATSAPALRNDALLALVSHSERAGALLGAIQRGTLNADLLPSTCLNLLRTHPDPVVSQAALRLFGPLTRARPAVVQHFEPALRLKGEPAHGREMYVNLCAGCHGAGGGVRSLGPDLSGAKVRGKEAVLRAILEPNLRTRPDFATCVAQTKEGETLVGVKMSQNASTLTLWLLGSGPTVWLMADIQSLRTESWSLMPEGLEQAFSLQDMADLLDFIFSP